MSKNKLLEKILKECKERSFMDSNHNRVIEYDDIELILSSFQETPNHIKKNSKTVGYYN